MEKSGELMVLNGEEAMTVDGMERIYRALTGKNFTPADRIAAQQKIGAHSARAATPQSTSGTHQISSGDAK